MRTINVKGTGEVTVAPDLICASINVNGVEKTYADAIKKSAETTNLLKEAIKRTGLEPSILKTTKLSIRPKHERYQDRKGWKEKFVGFQYAHKLSLEFDNDNKILGKVLYELANFGGESTFNIDYTVKDVESVRNELLKKAVEDSKRKAEVLAYAAKVKLGKIQNIDYSWGTVNIYTRPLDFGDNLRYKGVCYDSVAGSYDVDVDAEDITVEDTVTIVFEILD